MYTILIVLIILLVLGALPNYPRSYYPNSTVGIVLLVVVILILLLLVSRGVPSDTFDRATTIRELTREV